MRRTMIGTAAGIVLGLGATLAAQAQPTIDATGPERVTNLQTSSTYTAVVTCNRNFFLRLKVYLNGILKHDSNTFVANSGPAYNFSKLVNMSGWGHKAGDVLVYRGRATIVGTALYDEEDWTVVVTSPSTRLVPDWTRHLEVDRDREEWA